MSYDNMNFFIHGGNYLDFCKKLQESDLLAKQALSGVSIKRVFESKPKTISDLSIKELDLELASVIKNSCLAKEIGMCVKDGPNVEGPGVEVSYPSLVKLIMYLNDKLYFNHVLKLAEAGEIDICFGTDFCIVKK